MTLSLPVLGLAHDLLRHGIGLAHLLTQRCQLLMALAHSPLVLLDKISSSYLVAILAPRLPLDTVNPISDVIRGFFQLLQLQVSRLVEFGQFLHFLETLDLGSGGLVTVEHFVCEHLRSQLFTSFVVLVLG